MEKVDGRRARGVRTRDAIVSALMDLVGAGEVSPTAQQIADRAGVSVRSVYQHFTDVDGLFGEAAERLSAEVQALKSEIDPTRPLGERIAALTGDQAVVLERIVPFTRAVRVLAPGSAVLRTWRAAVLADHRARLELVFAAELPARPSPERERLLRALDVLTTAPAWDHLRQTGLSEAEAEAVMDLGLHALLGPRSPGTGDGRGPS